MMIRKSARFITDNPFRLLGVGSSTMQTELRPLASKIKHSVDVGLPCKAEMEAQFGAEELPGCMDIVRTLADDPKLLTEYRLFWPFTYEKPADETSRAHLDNCLFENQIQSSEFEDTHLSFLRAWYDFEINPSPDSIEDAFRFFAELYEDAECDTFLSRLLENEGHSNTLDIVYEAQAEVISHLLTNACSKAVQVWKSCDLQTAMCILTAVCESSFDDDAIDKALLVEVRSLGERESVSVRSEADTLDDSFEDPILSEVIARVEKLRQLALAVRNRIPVADMWLSTAQECVDKLSRQAHGHAMGLMKLPSGSDKATHILRRICRLNPSEDIRQQIEDDLSLLTRYQEVREPRNEKDRKLGRSRVAFEVDVTGSSVRIPAGCACCLASTEERKRISCTYGYPTEHTISLDLPYCVECSHHSQELESKKNKIILGTSGIAVLIMILQGILAPGVAFTTHIGICSVVTVIAMLLLGGRVRVTALHERHVSRDSPVTIRPVGHSIRFSFLNLHYATAFAKANNEQVRIAKKGNPNLETCLLRGASSRTVIAASIVLSLICSSVAYAIVSACYESRVANSLQSAETMDESAPLEYEEAQSSAQDAAFEARKQRLIQERNSLAETLRTTDNELSAEKSALDQEEQALREAKAQIEADRDFVDRGNEYEIQDFNQSVDRCNGDRQAFNAKVRQYNERVRVFQKDVGRLQEVETALSQMGVME